MLFRMAVGEEKHLPRELRPGTLYFLKDSNKLLIDIDDQRIELCVGTIYKGDAHDSECIIFNDLKEKLAWPK